MPCKPVKHPICQQCMLEYAWNEVSMDKNKTEISCPICNSEWGLHVIRKYGQATNKEIALLSECLSMNAIHADYRITQCPGCGSYCERIDMEYLRVICPLCEKAGKPPCFCWRCKQPWTNFSSKYDCNNPPCNSDELFLKQLQDAPMKEYRGVLSPSIRLCPKCGNAIENINPCRNMTCRACHTNFCFICLRDMNICLNYFECTPAPIQDRVPGR